MQAETAPPNSSANDEATQAMRLSVIPITVCRSARRRHSPVHAVWLSCRAVLLDSSFVFYSREFSNSGGRGRNAK
jgi:hypothetical protein